MSGVNIIHLIGYPGVGKLTIAKQMILQRESLVLVDNHVINNAVFAALAYDGNADLPSGIWARVSKVRDVVLDVMENLAAPHLSFVMTNVMIEDADDIAECRKIESVAVNRGGAYFPVLIACDLEENERRIVAAERKANFKAVDPLLPLRMRSGAGLIKSYDAHPNCIRLDVTQMPPCDAAFKILAHVFSN